jgi:hypothetical protein
MEIGKEWDDMDALLCCSLLVGDDLWERENEKKVQTYKNKRY